MRNRFDARTSTVPQCPMLSYHDGANACALESGHDDLHENHFGSACEQHGWGARASVIAYLGARYYQPMRRDHKGNAR
jgi:hypothetical protein